MPARLPFERQREGRIGVDVDRVDRIHLDRDGESHATSLHQLSLRGATATKQSRSREHCDRDCFAPLAMTAILSAAGTACQGRIAIVLPGPISASNSASTSRSTAMQPSVGAKSGRATCRKIALPQPGDRRIGIVADHDDEIVEPVLAPHPLVPRRDRAATPGGCTADRRDHRPSPAPGTARSAPARSPAARCGPGGNRPRPAEKCLPGWRRRPRACRRARRRARKPPAPSRRASSDGRPR